EEVIPCRPAALIQLTFSCNEVDVTEVLIHCNGFCGPKAPLFRPPDAGDVLSAYPSCEGSDKKSKSEIPTSYPADVSVRILLICRSTSSRALSGSLLYRASASSLEIGALTRPWGSSILTMYCAHRSCSCRVSRNWLISSCDLVLPSASPSFTRVLIASAWCSWEIPRIVILYWEDLNSSNNPKNCFSSSLNSGWVGSAASISRLSL